MTAWIEVDAEITKLEDAFTWISKIVTRAGIRIHGWWKHHHFEAWVVQVAYGVGTELKKDPHAFKPGTPSRKKRIARPAHTKAPKRQKLEQKPLRGYVFRVTKSDKD